ncbi:hypothetical protein E2562_032319 [Oryza meyeriana var. granulata]|uniref:Uncharacterized protein n=1 Tax=Oryza meyeriana var. granulata TaxID=110450 RepID=A0A6G1E5A0_9ORYZ|nr:hypothetical protein E2562_032319 [Oryza meyeriana var. granulata]
MVWWRRVLRWRRDSTGRSGATHVWAALDASMWRGPSWWFSVAVMALRVHTRSSAVGGHVRVAGAGGSDEKCSGESMGFAEGVNVAHMGAMHRSNMAHG